MLKIYFFFFKTGLCIYVCMCLCVLEVSLSSDFISGFCGETEEDHQQTLSLLREVGYNVGFLFAYSMRKVNTMLLLNIIVIITIKPILICHPAFCTLTENPGFSSATRWCASGGEAAEAGGVHQCVQTGSCEGQLCSHRQHSACPCGGSESTLLS